MHSSLTRCAQIMCLVGGVALQIAIAADGFNITVTKADADRFFGGKATKAIIQVEPPKGSAGEKVSAIYLLDFTKSEITAELLVSDASVGEIEPYISPDGTRFVFQRGTTVSTTKRDVPKDPPADIFVCELKPGAPGRTKVCTGFDPRWWVHPKTGEEYLIMPNLPQFTAGPALDFTCGSTLIQQLKKGTCQPQGGVETLVKGMMFNGGRSPDGRFTCTTRPGPVVGEFADPLAVKDATVKILNPDPGDGPHCNGSITQDPNRGAVMMFEDKTHSFVHIGIDLSKNDTLSLAKGFRNVQRLEWSTHPDYAVARLHPGSGSAEAETYVGGVLKISSKDWLLLGNGIHAVHVWVQP